MLLCYLVSLALSLSRFAAAPEPGDGGHLLRPVRVRQPRRNR
jgi:hypothetical protein